MHGTFVCPLLNALRRICTFPLKRAQAGNLYDGYDTVTSTEGFYAGVSNSNLKFVPPSKDPPKIQDNVRKLDVAHEALFEAPQQF